MNHLEILLLYLRGVLYYFMQMMPCMFVALLLFVVFRPLRKKRLTERDLLSTPARESALLAFVAFCAGLGALTLFPADLWAELIEHTLTPASGTFDWNSYYPGKEEIAERIAALPDVLIPFQEIRRAFRGYPWLLFIFFGNIIMFVPVGLFAGLLWRGPKWWKAFLTGLVSSTAIETVQLFIGRRTDVDDVILNTLGALLGYWIFCAFRYFFPVLSAQFHCQGRKDLQNGSPN